MKNPSDLFVLPKVVINNTAKDTKDLSKKKEKGEYLNWGTALWNLPKTWKQERGQGVKVAVLDTGVDLNHPDLKDGIKGYKDFTGEGINDVSGHGSHCAGVIGARINDTGTVGIAPECDLYIGKVLGREGGSNETVAAGVDWAVEQGVHLISMSLGGANSSKQLYESIHKALAQGVCLICAAGNEGSLYSNSIGYPGRYGSVITVAAHDPDGNRAGFSSRGGELDFMAPGTDIWSCHKDSGYASLSGTSMATPFVAGLAALVIGKHIHQGQGDSPLRNNEDLKNHLMSIAAHPGYHDCTRGYGPLLPFEYINRM